VEAAGGVGIDSDAIVVACVPLRDATDTDSSTDLAEAGDDGDPAVPVGVNKGSFDDVTDPADVDVIKSESFAFLSMASSKSGESSSSTPRSTEVCGSSTEIESEGLSSKSNKLARLTGPAVDVKEGAAAAVVTVETTAGGTEEATAAAKLTVGGNNLTAEFSAE
jgi:hypothetical protein